MRSGACPTTQIPYTCRSRACQGPPINPPIIARGTESGLAPLENRRTCHPRAWPIARTEGERRQRAQKPGGLILLGSEHNPTPRGSGHYPSPDPNTLFPLYSSIIGPLPYQRRTTRRPPGGGGLPLPAAASAVPRKSCKNQGSAQSDGAKKIEHRRKTC